MLAHSAQHTTWTETDSLPVALLHIPPENNMSLRKGARDHVCLVIFTMSHDICMNLRRVSQEDLSSGGIALWILNPWQLSRSVASAVEHDLGRLAEERSVEIWKLLTNKANTVVILQSLIEIEQMLRRIDSEGSKRYSKFDTFR